MTLATEYRVRLRRPHKRQAEFIDSPVKRKIIRAGRRGGKTTGLAIVAVKAFLEGRRILYATPTADQITRFWFEVNKALAGPIDAGIYYKNESMHIIEQRGTEQRIRAKTAWNSNTLRGDFADLLILDEWQLMDETAWDEVGAPMLLDNNGDAVFIYTPPSLHSRAVSKALDPRHASKMFKSAQMDDSGRWEAFHFTSQDNPHLSIEAFDEVASDMTALAYRQEILAEDIDEVPGALWTRELLEKTRRRIASDLTQVFVGVDPPGGATECGIVVAGMDNKGHVYILADYSLRASPEIWAEAVIDAYITHKADRILGEKNYGGDMVESTILNAARSKGIQVAYSEVQATRGKAVRAEPVAAKFERGEAHVVGSLTLLEDELTGWVPGDPNSPNRLDAMVWAATPFCVYREPEGIYTYENRKRISRY